MESVSSASDSIYNKLLDAGIQVLYDDRDVSPGVKFNDADLIGLPIRLTMSERSIQNGGVEFKLRQNSEKSIISITEIITRVKSAISELNRDIAVTIN
jgi:prolyl-tRNA synthetase